LIDGGLLPIGKRQENRICVVSYIINSRNSMRTGAQFGRQSSPLAMTAGHWAARLVRIVQLLRGEAGQRARVALSAVMHIVPPKAPTAMLG
jgi:hypothetical protein